MPVDTKHRNSSLAHVRAGSSEWSLIFKFNRRYRLGSSYLRKSGKCRDQRGHCKPDRLTRFQCTQQYSIIALTDETGNIKERYAYDAYGAPTIMDANGVELATSAENNRYMYTGREWDEDLGLYYYRARMYDPYSGRFCSRDPIGYVDGLSRYQYVGGRPIVATDSLGLFANSSTSASKRSGGVRVESRVDGGFVCSTGERIQNPDWEREVDGCSVPGAEFPFGTIFDYWNFYPACATHDGCYQTCGSDQRSCDAQMFEDMQSECDSAQDIFGFWVGVRCRSAARVYSAILRVAGWKAWGDRQNDVCKEEWRPCYFDCQGNIVIK